ncbi:hypothetical protein CNMCM5623_000619 [Aspergillus felis]|uniref:AB hydrolase-1 domain-containing protein n=1 Tax=Aspergillus felis TaxID=1287682 RepID=A0A8H6Q7Z2_9EURO|nr:hypothetical protein CNMCM5623_000619 [Aspergillus felis]
MLVMDKPAVVIVPGAWHRPQHYQYVINGLKNLGYEAEGVDLPSFDSNPPHATWEKDAEEVRRVILKYLDAGKDVITLAHSFGGIAMSEAVKGLGKESREAKGLKGSVSRLVYMCAMALPKGQSYEGQMKPTTPEEEELDKQRKEKYGAIHFKPDIPAACLGKFKFSAEQIRPEPPLEADHSPICSFFEILHYALGSVLGSSRDAQHIQSRGVRIPVRAAAPAIFELRSLQTL